MRRDDVEHALDALASEAPAPSADARSLIARGRRRILRQRLTIVGIALAVIATAASVGAVASNHDARRIIAIPTTTTTRSDSPTTTTPPTSNQVAVPAQLAFPAGVAGWICGDRVSYSTSDFDPYRGETKDVVIPPNPSAASGDYPQDPLCAAAPGGNFWLVRDSSNEDRSEIVHVTIRPKGDETSVSPFNADPFGRVEALDFVDANHGWALVAYQSVNFRTLYVTGDGGVNWSVLDQEAQIRSSLDFADTTHGWSISNNNPAKLATTSDGGRTWRDVDAPTTNFGDYGARIEPVFADGNTVVAAGAVSTGDSEQPFFDVSTDGGRTWALRPGPNVAMPGSEPNDFSAADADRWALGFQNHLYITDDGGRTWFDQDQFAGIDSIVHVTRTTERTMFVSGYGDAAHTSTVVLGSINDGANWTTIDFSAPPMVGSGGPINWPGGIVGCPTRTITPAGPGDPPPGLVDAAFEYISLQGSFDPDTASAVYKVGDLHTGEFGDLFNYQLSSCPPASVANAWVVELNGKPGSGGGGSTPQAQVVLAHDADGWHVFGRYH
jgi:hypothetical protein